MKRAYFVCLFQFLTTTFLLSQVNPVPLINPGARVVPPIGASQADPKARARILDSYGKLPLSFEANHGQADGRVKFLSRTSAYTLFLTGDEAVLALRGSAAKKPAPKGASGYGGDTVSLKRYPDTNPHPDTNPNPRTNPNPAANPNPATPPSMTGGVLRMKLRDANPGAKVSGLDELAGTSNYFIGNEPAKWRTNVPTYAKVKYEGIYSGIDLVYYGNQRRVEYDFVVAPGADPRRIVFDIRGAKRILRNAHGDLVLKMGEDEIRWLKPVVYQEKDGARQLVAAQYAITNRNRVGFEVAGYDASRPLYIDPVADTLIYSTYLGGNGADQGNGIAVDSVGNAYVTGYTGSSNFPTMDPLQPANDGGGDAFVTKINAAGSALVYSTYLGGSGFDEGFGIAVDSAGDAYVVGRTYSSDFPTMNPLQPANGGGSDAFVAKLNSAGSALVYSTYLGGGGNDYGGDIAVDSTGSAYVTGSTGSTNFPTMNPLQPANGGGSDAFVAKLNPSGSAFVYSTYLGGSGNENNQFHGGIAVDSTGSVYVTSDTTSSNFPTTPGVIERTCPHSCQYPEPYVTKFNPTGSALAYSTYLPGQIFDVGTGIAVDSAGDAYVVGTTTYPTSDAFLYKLNPTGSSLVGSHAGLSDSWGEGVALDSSGSAYVTGKQHLRVFIVKFNPGSATGPVFSIVYLHGNGQEEGTHVAVDNSDHAYVTGYTTSTNFPTKNPLQATFGGGGEDAFVAKIDMRGVTTTTISSSPNPSIYGQAVTFTATVTSYVGAPSDGGTVTFTKGTKVLGTGTLSGGSASFTTSTLPVGTNYVKAVYGGDSNLLGSTSKAVGQVVNKATTTTTLASSQNPSNFGQSVTFKASVTPQFSGTVKGSVTFYDGTTALKTVALSGGVAKFTTSTLTSGAHSITATYNGSANFIGSSASLTQTVN
jgi:Bacterial Ig-like domain (group 3)/Beta-propeller repeat